MPPCPHVLPAQASSGDAPEKWTCAVCKRQNPASANTCRVCRAKKGRTVKPASPPVAKKPKPAVPAQATPATSDSNTPPKPAPAKPATKPAPAHPAAKPSPAKTAPAKPTTKPTPAKPAPAKPGPKPVPAKPTTKPAPANATPAKAAAPPPPAKPTPKPSPKPSPAKPPAKPAAKLAAPPPAKPATNPKQGALGDVAAASPVVPPAKVSEAAESDASGGPSADKDSSIDGASGEPRSATAGSEEGPAPSAAEAGAPGVAADTKDANAPESTASTAAGEELGAGTKEDDVANDAGEPESPAASAKPEPEPEPERPRTPDNAAPDDAAPASAEAVFDENLTYQERAALRKKMRQQRTTGSPVSGSASSPASRYSSPSVTVGNRGGLGGGGMATTPSTTPKHHVPFGSPLKPQAALSPRTTPSVGKRAEPKPTSALGAKFSNARSFGAKAKDVDKKAPGAGTPGKSKWAFRNGRWCAAAPGDASPAAKSPATAPATASKRAPAPTPPPKKPAAPKAKAKPPPVKAKPPPVKDKPGKAEAGMGVPTAATPAASDPLGDTPGALPQQEGAGTALADPSAGKEMPAPAARAAAPKSPPATPPAKYAAAATAKGAAGKPHMPVRDHGATPGPAQAAEMQELAALLKRTEDELARAKATALREADMADTDIGNLQDENQRLRKSLADSQAEVSRLEELNARLKGGAGALPSLPSSAGGDADDGAGELRRQLALLQKQHAELQGNHAVAKSKLVLLEEEARQREIMVDSANSSMNAGPGGLATTNVHRQLERVTSAYENLQVERDTLQRRVQDMGKFSTPGRPFGTPIRDYDSILTPHRGEGLVPAEGTPGAPGLVDQLNKSQETINLLRSQLSAAKVSSQGHDEYTSLAALESELIVTKATANAAVEEMSRLKAKRAAQVVDYESLAADNENLRGMLVELEGVVHAGNREKHMHIEQLSSRAQLQSSEHEAMRQQLAEARVENNALDTTAAEAEVALHGKITRLRAQLADALAIAAANDAELDASEARIGELEETLDELLTERDAAATAHAEELARIREVQRRFQQQVHEWQATGHQLSEAVQAERQLRAAATPKQVKQGTKASKRIVQQHRAQATLPRTSVGKRTNRADLFSPATASMKFEM